MEAMPFGEQPIKMIPAAISGGRPLSLARVKPISGIIMKWLTTPMNTPLGVLITPAKSFSPIDVPMPNMINWISGVISVASLNPSTAKRPDRRPPVEQLGRPAHQPLDIGPTRP